MDLTTLMWACLRAFIVSFVLAPIIRDIFRSYNVVDRPGRRKVHAYPIPRVGGIPIAIAYVVALTTLRGTGSVFPVHWLQTILSGALVIFLVGLIDDFLNLKPVIKLLGQIVAAVVAYNSGLSIDRLGGIELPVWISLPATVFWLLLTTNALNLIDGLDGLCGGIAFCATLSFFGAAWMTSDWALAFTVLPLAGALLGFLFFNFNPATVFLGDSGALLLGFLLGCFGIVWTGDNVTPVGVALPFLALGLPMLDLGLSIVRRSLKGQGIFSADRGHIHHRLLDRGLTVRRGALTLYAVGILGGGAGILISWPGAGEAMRWAVTAALILAVVAGIHQLRYAEFKAAVNLLFRGDFRKAVSDKARMEQLAQALGRAGTREEWWRHVVAAAREWNWIRLKSKSPNGIHDEVLAAARRPSWSFAVELGEAESIEVEGDGQAGIGTPDLQLLASILSQTFQQRCQDWKQPAVS